MKTIVSHLDLALALVLTVITTSGFANVESKASTEAQLTSVNTDMVQLKKRLEALNKERFSAEKKLQGSDAEIGKIQKKIRTIEARLREGEAKLKRLTRRQQALTEEKNRVKDRTVASIQSAYLTSRDNRLKLLLNQEDPNEISRQLTYLDYLQKAQVEAIHSFESIISELNANAEHQHIVNEQLVQQKTSLLSKQKQLKKERQSRQKLIANIQQRYQSSDKELSALNQQKQKLEDVLASIASRGTSGKPFTTVKGALPWPVKGVVRYTYNQTRPGTPIQWPGLFIDAQAGSAVTAIHSGTVIFSDWLRGYGQLAIVDHGDGYLSLYGHNEWLLKKEGDSVMAGEELALSGQSGGQSRPGLYLEIRQGGKPLNPLPWLSKWSASL